MEVIDVVEYEGYDIHVSRDDYAECPWEAWDCEPPLLASHYDLGRSSVRRYACAGDADGLLVSGVPDSDVLTDDVIRKHWQDVLEIGRQADPGRFGFVSYDDTIDGLKTLHADQGQACLVDSLREYLEEALEESAVGDRFDHLAEVWSWCGVVALSTSTCGYCQGDYSELLIVAMPEFLARTGAVIDKPEDLKGSKDLFAAWAWGDVYAYNVTQPCPRCGNNEDVGLSCGGFYGDPEKSGLLEDARLQIGALNKARA